MNKDYNSFRTKSNCDKSLGDAYDELHKVMDEIIWQLSSEERIKERKVKIDNLLNDE